MADRHTLEELNNCSREELITIVLMMQGQLDTLNENIERLIEQVRIANSHRFGKHAETLDSIDGQLSFFDEAESCCDLSVLRQVYTSYTALPQNGLGSSAPAPQTVGQPHF